MTNPIKRMPRGAIPSPLSAIAAAKPYIPDLSVSVPSCYLMFPNKLSDLSYWGNYQFGDCVTAEEAFAKLVGNQVPYEAAISNDVAVAWAKQNGYLNGASLYSVLVSMTETGFPAGWNWYLNNGPFNKLDWTDSATLQSAIYTSGPVKLGVGSGHFEDLGVTPGTCGWQMYNYPQGDREDHCVSLCGYGPHDELLDELSRKIITSGASGFSNANTAVTSGMPSGTWYAIFTWNSVGIIDEQSMLNMTHEAWVRNPVTVNYFTGQPETTAK